jgi:tRNA(His) 5'-end guanylyltransferase
MSSRDDLGDRMKRYEAVTQAVLPRRTYTIVRVDGMAFHTLLSKADRPYDADVMEVMDNVAEALCRRMSGSVFAYSQSDEVSVLLADFGSVHTEPWFGGNVQKIVSGSASLAAAVFNQKGRDSAMLKGTKFVGNYGIFDSRVFTIPTDVDVANYFLWRQWDATNNSVSSAARAKFSHKSLLGVNTGQMQERLFTEAGINWNDYPASFKRGRVCMKAMGVQQVRWTDKRTGEEHTASPSRTWWASEGAPVFSAEPGQFLSMVIPVLPTLSQ